MSLTLIQIPGLDSSSGVQALAALSAADLELYVFTFLLFSNFN